MKPKRTEGSDPSKQFRGRAMLVGTHSGGVALDAVLVIADTGVLDTLSPRQFRAGYAEVAKYGVLGDSAFFDWLDANHAGIFSGGAAREHAIAMSCRAKAAIVARDEDRAAAIMAEHFDVIAKILEKHQGHGRFSSIAFRPRGPRQSS